MSLVCNQFSNDRRHIRRESIVNKHVINHLVCYKGEEIFDICLEYIFYTFMP